MLFEDSEEFQKLGLNLIKGSIKIMKNNKIKLPHMGWNKIFSTKNNNYGLENTYQYFVHSYVAYNVIPEQVIYQSTYFDEKFIAGVKKNNIIGLQFHPERSGNSGMELLTKIILDQYKKIKP